MLPTLRNSLLFPSLSDEFFGKNLLSDFFGKSIGFDIPAVNIAESGEAFEIEVAAPGLSKEDFKIDVHNNVLTISSEKEEKKEEVKKEKIPFNWKPILYILGTLGFSGLVYFFITNLDLII